MIARVATMIALWRPVGEHAVITTLVEVDDPQGSRASWDLEQEARLIAAEMAVVHPRCVMVMRTRVVDILEL